MPKGKRKIEITDAEEGPEPAETEEPPRDNGDDEQFEEGSEVQTAENAEEDAPIAELQAEIRRLQQELEEERDKRLRAIAELQNYRKRTTREQREKARYAGQPVLSRILPVMDNLRRILEHEADAGTEDFATGVRMTVDEFFRVLDELGVGVLDCEGEPFDPAVHDAVARVETDEVPEGTIVEVDTPGYCLHDRCLRPARVVVATRPEGRGDNEENDEESAS